MSSTSTWQLQILMQEPINNMFGAKFNSVDIHNTFSKAGYLGLLIGLCQIEDYARMLVEEKHKCFTLPVDSKT